MNNSLKFILGALLVVVALGLAIPVMDIDAAQYASISSDMLRSGKYLHVYDAGKEYLDKPPLLFWISACSMKLFGNNNFGYRLPSVLFAFLAVYATYRLTALYYEKERARLAAVVLACSQGFVLMCHDVRTDTMLMGWVIFSVWQLARWAEENKRSAFFWGCAGIAFGMMTKGPVALLVPGFAILPQLLFKKQIRIIFDWRMLAGILLIVALLLPMSWGLYTQFDLHPEKNVNGSTNVSGLRFFYWTQSFGRITGESTWNNDAGILFLFQNMLWSFLPWIPLFVIALYMTIKQSWQSRLKHDQQKEIIALSGFVLSYLSLGLSKYQLPHYIFVAFPFAAIMTSGLLEKLTQGELPTLKKYLTKSMMIVYVLLWTALVLLMQFPFPDLSVIWTILAVAGTIGLFFLYKRYVTSKYRLIYISCYTILGLNLLLNAAFYPKLLEFQAGSMVGKWMKERHIPASKTGIYQFTMWRSLHFYADGIIPQKDSLSTYQKGDFLITTKEKMLEIGKERKIAVLFETPDYPITRLSLEFLQPEKRSRMLQKVSLIQFR